MFDQRYVDVDFRAEAVRVGVGTAGPDGNIYCGWNEEDERRKLGETNPVFEEVFANDLIPESNFREILEDTGIALSGLKRYQYNQRNEGTCTGNAAAQAYAYQWKMQFPSIELVATPSPIAHYRGHRCGSGPNSGSSVYCNMNSIKSKGTLLIKDTNSMGRAIYEKAGLPQEHLLNAVGFYQSFDWNSAWLDTAKHFRFDEMYDVATGQGFFTALLRGFTIVYGRQGHAICAADVVYRSGGLYAKYDNSWGEWGDNGFGYDSQSLINRSSRGAIAVRSIVVPTWIDKLMPV